MNDAVRHTLKQLIADHGRMLINESRRCEGLLRDKCPHNPREVNVLVMALKEGVAADLLNHAPPDPPDLLLARLTRKLHDNLGLAEAFAHWAVDSWAMALGVIAQPRGLVVTASAVSPTPVETTKVVTTNQVVTTNMTTEVVTTSLNLTEFSFETVRVNETGKVIEKKKLTARQQVFSLPGNVKLEMVYIPGGTFTIGSPNTEANRYDSENNGKRVTLPPFFMGKYAVTQTQWKAVMGKDSNPSNFKGDNRPVETVNWHESVDFCQKLSKLTGQAFRLPGEAEWEYACRAGTSTPFAFGPTITPEIVNYNGNYPYGQAAKGQYRAETTPVGGFPANGFGLYDMHGNVWEWCADNWRDSYANLTDSGGWNDSVSYTQSARVLRGGSWLNFGHVCRSANRLGNDPDFRDLNWGFRVARGF